MSTALTFEQALKRRRLGKSAFDDIKRDAKAAADDLIAPLRALSRREQISVAEALIGAFMGQIREVAKPARTVKFDPNQPRDDRGRWTLSGMAGAAARGGGRLALGAGKIVLRAAHAAISSITLVPSSKTTVSEALSSWWARVTSSDSTTHIEAVQEAAARTMFTVILGAAAIGLAHAFLGAAAGKVGAAIGAALRVVLGR